MVARRLIVALIALLLLSAFAAALLPGPRSPSGPTVSTSTRERGRQARVPGGHLVRVSVDAASRRRRTIRLEVGDELRLRVSSRAPDQVAVRGFGQLEAVSRFSPARFDLLATHPGSFRVHLVQERQTIARILVAHGLASNERPG